MPATITELYKGTIEEKLPIAGGNLVYPSNIGSGDITSQLRMVFGDIQSRTYVAGSSGWKINFLGDAEFNNVTVRGTIVSSSGNIGGWNITANSIQTGAYNTVGTRYFGTSGLSLSNTFRVDSSGNLTASNATISGAITATSGNISGVLTIGGDNNVKIDGPNGRITISDGTNDRILIGNI